MTACACPLDPVVFGHGPRCQPGGSLQQAAQIDSAGFESVTLTETREPPRAALTAGVWRFLEPASRATGAGAYYLVGEELAHQFDDVFGMPANQAAA
jgi:hypothetical protein